MILFLAFATGLLVGSFLNVCIHRWPREESVVKPRSHCPHCGTGISWYDNIPVLSFLWLAGRCRHCGTSLSIRYPLVEVLNGLLYACLVWRFGLQPLTLKMAVFGSMMLILIFTDLAEYILPDEVTLGGLALGLVLSPFIHLDAGLAQILWLLAGAQPPAWASSMAESALAALILGGLLYGVGEFYRRVRHIEGLGLGDVKMIAMVGAFWGFPNAVLILILGSLVGAVTGLLIIAIGRKKWTHALPFGSYVGAAAILVTIWGDAILNWYWAAVLPGAM